jgi:uncharacterized protein (TIGR03503 family)
MDKNDRIGIISFDRYSKTLTSLRSLSHSGDLAKLEEMIDRIYSKGLFTDFYIGLNQALFLFLEKNKEKRSGARKVVIFLTDGVLDLPLQRKDEKKETLRKLKKELIPEFKKNGISIFSIALTEKADQKLLEDISLHTAGSHYLALSSKDLYRVFMDIFEATKHPASLPLYKNRFLIDPNIEEVILWIPKKESNEEIILERPDKTEILCTKSEKGIKWQSDLKYDLITIEKPQVGEWIIHTKEDNRNKRKVIILTNIEVETSLKSNYFDISKSPVLSAWLTKDGTRITGYPFLSNVIFKVIVNGPEPGSAQDIKLYDDGYHNDNTPFDGIFTNRLELLKRIGKYKITFLAMGKTFQRQKVLSFWVRDSALPLRIDKDWFNVSLMPANPTVGSPLLISTSINHKAPILTQESISARIIYPRGRRHTVKLVAMDKDMYQGGFGGIKEGGIYQVIVEIKGKDEEGKAFFVKKEPIIFTVKLKPVVLSPKADDWSGITKQFLIGNLLFLLTGFFIYLVKKHKTKTF